MQHGKVEDSIEVSGLVPKGGYVALSNYRLVLMIDKPVLRPLNHLWVEVDGDHTACAEVPDFSHDAFTGPTSNVENLEALGMAAEFNEFRG